MVQNLYEKRFVCALVVSRASEKVVRTHLRRRNRQNVDMLLGTSPSPVVLTTNTATEHSNACEMGTESSDAAAVSNPRRPAMAATYSATS